MLTKEMLMQFNKAVLADKLLAVMQKNKELQADFDKQGNDATDMINDVQLRKANLGENIDDMESWVRSMEVSTCIDKVRNPSDYHQGYWQAFRDVLTAMDNVKDWEVCGAFYDDNGIG